MRIVKDWMTTGLPGWVIWVPAGLFLWLLALIDLAVLGLSIRRQLAASAAMLVEPAGFERETPSLSTDNRLEAPVLIEPRQTHPPWPGPGTRPAEVRNLALPSHPACCVWFCLLRPPRPIPLSMRGVSALQRRASARRGFVGACRGPPRPAQPESRSRWPHRDDDMQKARASLDQAEQALTKLRGQQHALIAGLVGLRRHVH